MIYISFMIWHTQNFVRVWLLIGTVGGLCSSRLYLFFFCISCMCRFKKTDPTQNRNENDCRNIERYNNILIDWSSKLFVKSSNQTVAFCMITYDNRFDSGSEKKTRVLTLKPINIWPCIQMHRHCMYICNYVRKVWI